MAQEAHCPKCGAALDAAKLAAGERVRCGGCGAMLTVAGAKRATPLNSDEIRTLWSKSLSPGVTPGMSIKQKPHRAGGGTHVVVKSHRVSRGPKPSVKSSEAPDFELLEVLGEGGMGVVYTARQTSVDRPIAVKMLKDDAVHDPARRASFLSEAAVTGNLEHPNIVPVYDLGATEDGALLYAMKHVKGTAWAEVFERKTQTENVEILMRVADAAAFAHSRGVIHRDLKPANVMLGDFGEVLVMDWGLAASVTPAGKAERLEETGGTGGTPVYMAPEMARAVVADIGFASDVYLLGAILYHIVTGKPPHAGKNAMQCILNAARNEIEPAEKHGELLEIALKAMATEPAARYATVKEFQAAIRDYQSHAESARLSQQAAEHLAKAESTREYNDHAQALFAYREARSLWSGNEAARQGESAARLAYAGCALAKNDLDLAASLLDATDPAHQDLVGRVAAARRERDVRRRRLRALTIASLGLTAAVVVTLTAAFLWVRVEQARTEAARVRAESERGRAIAAEAETRSQRDVAEAARAKAVTAEAEARAQRDAAEDARKKAVAAEQAATSERDKARYEAYIATVGLTLKKIDEGSVRQARGLLADCPAELRRWEWGYLWGQCDRSLSIISVDGSVRSIDISSDGKRIVAGVGGGYAHLRDLETGKATLRINVDPADAPRVAFSPGDKEIAAAGKEGVVRLCDAATGEAKTTFASIGKVIQGLHFSPGGQFLACAADDGFVYVWDTRSARQALEIDTGKRRNVHFVRFSPDGRMLATGNGQANLLLWDTRTGKSLGDVQAEPGNGIGDAAFDPSGKRLIGGDNTGGVTIWDLRQRTIVAQLPGKIPRLSGTVAVSPDGRTIAAAGSNAVTLWDAETLQERFVLRGHDLYVSSIVFTPDSRRLITGSADQTVRVWDVFDENRSVEIRGERPGAARDAVFSPDSRRVALAEGDSIAIAEAASGKVLQRLRGENTRVDVVAFAGDGKWLVSGGGDELVRLWDVDAGQVKQVWRGHSDDIRCVAFSPDGKTVASGGNDQTVRLWDRRDGKALFTLTGHTGIVYGIAFTPDGKMLASAGYDGPMRLWDPAEGKLLRTFSGHRKVPVNAIAISPDGRRLISASWDTRVLVTDIASGEVVLDLNGDAGKLYAVAVSPDGRRIVSGGVNGIVRLWDAETGREVLILAHLPTKVTSLAFSPDGNRILAICGSRTVTIWTAAPLDADSRK